jgi:hypothetical protein
MKRVFVVSAGVAFFVWDLPFLTQLAHRTFPTLRMLQAHRTPKNSTCVKE